MNLGKIARTDLVTDLGFGLRIWDAAWCRGIGLRCILVCRMRGGNNIFSFSEKDGPFPEWRDLSETKVASTHAEDSHNLGPSSCQNAGALM